MAKKQVKLPSIYGPVAASITMCDGPECSSCVLPDYMVGWFAMAPQGLEVPTMGGMPDAMDFCSLICLKQALDMMTG